MNPVDPALATGLAVALGAGLLVGTERERHKARQAGREAAGLRSFAVAALVGALAAVLDTPGLLAACTLGAALLAAVAHQRSRSEDPGLSTEIAWLAVLLIGARAMSAPLQAAAAAVLLTVLLAARNPLHRFAVRTLSAHELQDGLLVLSLGLIVLPLLPDGPVPALAGLAPRSLAATLLMLLLVQTLGHAAQRALGLRRGLLLAGLVSGFVSSTATVLAFGARARRAGAAGRLWAAGATLSGAATWLQVQLIVSALLPAQALDLLPMTAGGVAGALVAAALLAWRAPAAQADAEAVPDGSALHPGQALGFALLLAAVAYGLNRLHQAFGAAGLHAGVALAALADAHAPVAALAALASRGALDSEGLARGIGLAVAANTLSRLVLGHGAGGGRYGLQLAAGLLLSLAAASLGGLGALGAWG